MAQLNGIIGIQAFELVRDRIGSIIADEMANQYAMSYDEDLNLDVWIERLIRFDHTELPAINVVLERGELDGHSQVSTDGTYTYDIDVYTSAKADDSETGDTKAMLKLHKIIGKCRSILENSRYKTLGFSAPFVMNRGCRSIQIKIPDSQEALNVVIGRLTMTVKVPETSELITPELIAGYDTVVKLYETDKGYVFSGNAIPVPPSYGGEVFLNGVSFGIVQEGEELDIVVVDTNNVLVGSKISGVWVVPAAGGDDAARIAGAIWKNQFLVMGPN